MSIPDGFNTLLKALEDEACSRDVSKITAHSDNSLADSELFRESGFGRAADIPPTYSVLYRVTRHPASAFKRERFRKDPKLAYAEDVRLADLYAANNMHRVWDYGKVRWELDLP